MFCSQCGNKLKDDDKFCGNCGAKVASDSAPRRQKKTMARFTAEEAAVAQYIGTKSEKGYRLGSLGRNDGITLLDWIEKYADNGDYKGVALYLCPPIDDLCKLKAIILDNDCAIVEGREWGMDYNDDKPIDILFGVADADRVEFDGQDCMYRFIPFV